MYRISYASSSKSDRLGGKLYLESLSDVLAIHLLRNYCVFDPVLRQSTKG
ncbi:MAG: hypothetical protein QNJ72_05475 [Pleurocapsa sp. MO_226.B13]|nr:hypothetical protein [Pleurocapsa sp. MO_226.B13]